MNAKQNILLALIFVMGITSALYADRPNRRDNRNDPRGKDRPVMQDKRAPQPVARTPVKHDVRTPAPAPRPNNVQPIDRRPANVRPAARPQPPQRDTRIVQVQKPQPPQRDVRIMHDRRPQPPHRDVRIMHVRPPQPREIVKVVNVYQNVTPYCEYNDKQVFYVTILNRTGRTLDLELDGSHEGDDDIGKLYPGEEMEYPLVVKSNKLPETFELEAGPFDMKFTLDHYSPRDIVLVVTPGGIYAE